MSYSNLLTITEHRPWPLPEAPWILRQRWLDLLFAHWPVPLDTMRVLVPPQLQIDSYEGMAWVSIVPFRVTDFVPRHLPAIPWVSAFPELNVRTYVKVSGDDLETSKPGIFFFSLDAANAIAIAGARLAYKLPYFRAKMSIAYPDNGPDNEIVYTSHRTHADAPPADFEAAYAPSGPVYASQWGTLDHWLAERYCLYTVARGQLYRAEIHHASWPLQPATAQIAVNSMAAAANVPLAPQPPVLHFARRQDVLTWPLVAVG